MLSGYMRVRMFHIPMPAYNKYIHTFHVPMTTASEYKHTYILYIYKKKIHKQNIHACAHAPARAHCTFQRLMNGDHVRRTHTGFGYVNQGRGATPAPPFLSASHIAGQSRARSQGRASDSARGQQSITKWG